MIELGEHLGVIEFSIGAMVVATRLATVARMWRLPRTRGDGFFFGTAVEAGFYEGEGRALLQGFRLGLVGPMVLDLPIALAAGLASPGWFMAEQVFAWIASMVAWNLVLYHFAERARVLRPVAEENRPPPAGVPLQPRRLAEHTSPVVELALLALVVPALVLAFRFPDPVRFRACVWILYLEVGLLLLKDLLVRWRMRIPARRAEDYLRWRQAALSCNVVTLDSIRLFLGAVLLAAALHNLDLRLRLAGILMAGLALVLRSRRAQITVNLVAREVDPWSLMAEIPAARIEGRFAAAGLLLIEPGNPSVMVRGPAGIALNAANWQTWGWLVYLLGLLAIGSWFLA